MERAITVPSKSNNPYGAIDAAFIILNGAHLIRVDMPPNQQDPKTGFESLNIRGRQIGLFLRDTTDDIGTMKQAFLLALQDEPESPLQRNDFQSRQAGDMMEMVMGLVLVPDLHHPNTYCRLGLGRWVDSRLFRKTQAQTIKLV